jgi:hypothetical protein
MRYNQKAPEPTRGIIIVDTSALLPLLPPLPENVVTPDVKASRASDLLFWLGLHGYQVKVPERVAHECGSFMRDGQSLDAYFQYNAKNPYLVLAQPFIRAIESSDANIALVPPPDKDTTLAAELVRTAWNIHHSKASDGDKRLMIKELRKKTQHGRDEGEIAAAELIRHMQPPKVPVFYLTNDKDACERVGSANPKIPVNQMNASGLYYALYNANLLGAAGFKDIPFEQFFLHANTYLQEQGIQKKRSAWYVLNALDTPPQNVHNARERMPFRASLSGLKAEIEQKKATEEAPPPSPCDTSGLDKFRKRFGSLGNRVNKTPPGTETQR